MQIFVLDQDPVKAAKMACDKHVIKICTEVGQVLATALHGRGVPTSWKPTHKNHPISKWVENRSHALWAWEHGIALCREYSARFGGKVHKTQGFLESIGEDLSSLLDPGWEGFCPAYPVEYEKGTVIASYRAYYQGERIRSFAAWRSPSSPPSWWTLRLTSTRHG